MKSSYDTLGNYIRIVDERNRDLSITRLLGVSIEKKFISSIANTVGTDFRGYKIVRTRQFAYGSVTSRNGEKISVALLNDDDCIISSSYTVFEVTDSEKLLPEYLMLWFMRPEFDHYARYKSHGSVREIFSWDEMCAVELPVPAIEKQREIVKAYRTITDRIALKQRINENLTAQANTIFKKLVQHEEPNAVFSEIATVESGKRPNSTVSGVYPLVGAGGIMNYIDEYNYSEKILVTGRVGTHGIIQRITENCWASDNTLVIKSGYYEFAYHFLKSVSWDMLNRGSTQPLVTQTDIKRLPLYVPDSTDLEKFEFITERIMMTYEINNKEIKRLKNITDILISSLSKS